jgi:hypothetical protein
MIGTPAQARVQHWTLRNWTPACAGVAFVALVASRK